MLWREQTGKRIRYFAASGGDFMCCGGMSARNMHAQSLPTRDCAGKKYADVCVAGAESEGSCPVHGSAIFALGHNNLPSARECKQKGKGPVFREKLFVRSANAWPRAKCACLAQKCRYRRPGISYSSGGASSTARSVWSCAAAHGRHLHGRVEDGDQGRDILGASGA